MDEELRQALANITSLLGSILQALSNPEEIAVRTLTVPTAGTPRQFPDVQIPDGCEVAIEALSTNTGTVYVANSSVDATDPTQSKALLAGNAVGYKIKNPKQLWLNSTVNGEGVTWTVEH